MGRIFAKTITGEKHHGETTQNNTQGAGRAHARTKRAKAFKRGGLVRGFHSRKRRSRFRSARMLDNVEELLEAIAAPCVLALFGGLARACRFGIKSWRQFMSSVVVSAFTGVVVHLLIQETTLSTSVQAAIMATSGYSGGAILDAVQARIIKAVHHLPGPGADCDDSDAILNGKDQEQDARQH